MEDHVYSTTLFWQVMGGINDFAGWFMPIFLFVASVAWASNFRSILSYVALMGGILAILARVSHWLVPSVSSIALGYSEPTIEQNPITWFLYVQAFNFGSLIFVVCVGIHFIFGATHNKFIKHRCSQKTAATGRAKSARRL